MPIKKFGADPEVFIGYPLGEKTCVLPPSFLRLMHNHEVIKNGRHPIFIKKEEYIVHEDGAALEVGVIPSANWEDLWERINRSYEDISTNLLALYPNDCDGKVHILPTITYDVERWKGYSEEFHMSNIFGCDADIDAFDTEREAEVIDATLHDERYGGGHIHTSGSELASEDPISAIKFLAMTAGNAAIAYSDVPSLEKARTYLYGKPGKFRVQKYSNGETGIEYRTPSNTWTKDKKIAERIFTWFKVGIENLLEQGLGFELIEELTQPTIDAIINADQSLALQILTRIEERI